MTTPCPTKRWSPIMRSCTQSRPESFGPSGQSAPTSTRRTSHGRPTRNDPPNVGGKAEPQNPDGVSGVNVPFGAACPGDGVNVRCAVLLRICASFRLGFALGVEGDAVGRPLEGVRVVDLSQVTSGPLATMVLAEQGADVMKVEPPGVGDVHATCAFQRGGLSSWYLNHNRGKRSIAVSTETDEGRDDRRGPDGRCGCRGAELPPRRD